MATTLRAVECIEENVYSSWKVMYVDGAVVEEKMDTQALTYSQDFLNYTFDSERDNSRPLYTLNWFKSVHYCYSA